MTTSMIKPRKSAGRKKAGAKSGLGLPPAISTLEIEGKRYYLTPAADMTEWLEDLEDVMDSVEAMQDAANAIPWEEARKTLGLAPAKSRTGK